MPGAPARSASGHGRPCRPHLSLCGCAACRAGATSDFSPHTVELHGARRNPVASAVMRPVVYASPAGDAGGGVDPITDDPQAFGRAERARLDGGTARRPKAALPGFQSPRRHLPIYAARNISTPTGFIGSNNVDGAASVAGSARRRRGLGFLRDPGQCRRDLPFLAAQQLGPHQRHDPAEPLRSERLSPAGHPEFSARISSSSRPSAARIASRSRPQPPRLRSPATSSA